MRSSTCSLPSHLMLLSPAQQICSHTHSIPWANLCSAPNHRIIYPEKYSSSIHWIITKPQPIVSKALVIRVWGQYIMQLRPNASCFSPNHYGPRGYLHTSGCHCTEVCLVSQWGWFLNEAAFITGSTVQSSKTSYINKSAFVMEHFLFGDDLLYTVGWLCQEQLKIYSMWSKWTDGL